jgi:SchA/CurD like domain
MAYAAITFNVRPGTEDRVDEIFAGFQRATSAVVEEDGREVARILGTALFIKNTTLVRVIHYEGDLAAVSRFMGRQHGVREAERKLAEILETPRDSSTDDGFRDFFRNSSMRSIAQFSAPTELIVDTLAHGLATP